MSREANPNSTPELSPVEFLVSMDACPEAVEWAQGSKDLEYLWRTCAHAEWLIWTLEQFECQERFDTRLRLFATVCARHHWHLLPDPLARQALEAVERFISQPGTVEELRRARAAAKLAANQGVIRADWTAASAAAAMAAYYTTLANGLAAAREASKFGIRAAAWDLSTYVSPDEEDAWQAEQLRRIMEPDIQELREIARGKFISVARENRG